MSCGTAGSNTGDPVSAHMPYQGVLLSAGRYLDQAGVRVRAVAEGEEAVPNASERVGAKGDQRPQRQLEPCGPGPDAARVSLGWAQQDHGGPSAGVVVPWAR